MVDGALLCCFLCFQMFHSVVVHALPTPTPASIVSTVRITHRWPTYTIGLEGQTSKMYHEPQNKEGQYHQQRDTENTMRIEATGHYLAKNEKKKRSNSSMHRRIFCWNQNQPKVFGFFLCVCCFFVYVCNVYVCAAYICGADSMKQPINIGALKTCTHTAMSPENACVIHDDTQQQRYVCDIRSGDVTI